MHKILHLDLDCFYAAVEIKHQPHLRGKPVAVGGPPNSRSVVCTANYEARAFGVKAALPSSRAVRLCPQLVLIPPHFDLYKKESKAVLKIFERFTSKIQPLSLDEAYLDVTEIAKKPGEATEIAREIKKAVTGELNLTISAGVAPNKFLAKIASDWKKPDGLFVIPPEKVDRFIVDLPVEKLFGVGRVTAARMHKLGLNTCGDMQKWSLLDLRRHFGSRAFEYYQLSRGLDDREVETEGERKSLSVEETFGQDINNWQELMGRVPDLYTDFTKRLERLGPLLKIQSVFIKVKFHDFKQTTHESAYVLPPTQQIFERLLQDTWIKRSEPIRLLGLGVRFGKALDQAQMSFQEFCGVG